LIANKQSFWPYFFLSFRKNMMENNSNSNDKTTEQKTSDNSSTESTGLPKHNPFEDKRDSLSKEEEEAIEQFKEAQTERD
jgi:hypothetical protein